jgi:hypothetical protein
MYGTPHTSVCVLELLVVLVLVVLRRKQLALSLAMPAEYTYVGSRVRRK